MRRTPILLAILTLLSPIPLSADDAVLEYDWEEGYIYSCTYEAALKRMTTSKPVTGTVRYIPQGEAKAVERIDSGPQVSTGTGFLVTADGYVVTCSHVVEHAKEITVRQDGKDFTAKVVRDDPSRDLAVLKVPVGAAPFPRLEFGDSDDVELAQDVHVIGYPLAHVLGESVKITRGTISGITRDAAEHRFQIDARVNPGNSGGPVVDGKGRVVGIASELLAAETIDAVGFSIPGNQAIQLLQDAGVAVKPISTGTDLDGPALARGVAPSVCYISVKKDPAAAVSAPRSRLSVTCSARDEADDFGRPVSESGNLVVDTLGEVIQTSCDELVPQLFMSAATVGLERLPGEDRDHWKSSRMVLLSVRKKQPASSPYSPLMRPHFPIPSIHRPPSIAGFPFSSPEPEPEILPVIVEEEYQRLPPDANGTPRVGKHLRIRSIAAAGSKQAAMSVLVEMKGVLTWSDEDSLFKEAAMTGEITLTKDGGERKTPVEFEYAMTKKKIPPPTAAKPVTTPETVTPSVRNVAGEDSKAPGDIERVPATVGLSRFNPDD